LVIACSVIKNANVVIPTELASSEDSQKLNTQEKKKDKKKQFFAIAKITPHEHDEIKSIVDMQN